MHGKYTRAVYGLVQKSASDLGVIVNKNLIFSKESSFMQSFIYITAKDLIFYAPNFSHQIAKITTDERHRRRPTV